MIIGPIFEYRTALFPSKGSGAVLRVLLVWSIFLLATKGVAVESLPAENGCFSHTVSAPDIPKRFLSFSLTSTFSIGADVVSFTADGIINDAAHTIQVNIPYSAAKTSLTASFTLTAGTLAYLDGIRQKSDTTVNNFTVARTYEVRATDGTITDYAVTVTNKPIETLKQIVLFSFNGIFPNVGCVIDENYRTITAVLPFGTTLSLSNLVASFETTSSITRVKVDGVRQISGITPNSFINPLIYTCIAEDGSSVEYRVTAMIAPASSSKRITDFRFNGLSAPSVGTINDTEGTISVTIPWAANKADLVATFTNSPFSTIRIGNILQNSGFTHNDFSSPRWYTVTAQDQSIKNYLVFVEKAPPASGNSILAFNFESQFDPDIIGTIDELTNTITLVVPYSQDVTALKASFITSSFSTMLVGSAQQFSGVTANNYTSSVSYSCIAENGATALYTVIVSKAPVVTNNRLLSFRFNELDPDAIGLVDTAAYTVTVHLPVSQSANGLVATFSLSPLARAFVGGVPQTSGLTANNFSVPVVYTIQAENGSTRNYIVNLIKDEVRTAKVLETFSFQSLVPPVQGLINQELHQIAVEVPFTTDVTELVATFTKSYMATVLVDNKVQVPGITINDFSVPVNYSVFAEDGSSQNYLVMVTKKPVSSAKQITNFWFEGLVADAIGTISEEAGMIIVTIPWSADINNLVAGFSCSPLDTVKVGNVPQTSGVSSHSFSSPVVYTVMAEDRSTKNYRVIVNRAAAATGNAILSFNFENQFDPDIIGTIDNSARTINLVVPFTTEITGLVPSFICSRSASVFFDSSIQISGETPNNFTFPLLYNCRAEDGSTEIYTVTVTHAPASSAKQILDFRFNMPDSFCIGVIDHVASTIKLRVPFGTDISYLVGTFTISPLAKAEVDGMIQVSGETPHNFYKPVIYRVIAEDNTEKYYWITVSIDPNSEKKLYSFDFNGLTPKVVGIINEFAKTVQLNVPYTTNWTNLVATFSKSIHATVKVGNTIQESGVTPNNFSNGLVYTILAEDGSAQNYSVTVTRNPISSAKQISDFWFTGFAVPAIGIIDENAGTITVAIPFEAGFTNLVANFTNSDLSKVRIGNVLQMSGLTPNDFTLPLTYLVTAENGTTKNYIVTVVKSPPEAGNTILSFNFEAQFEPDIIGTINQIAKTITLTVPFTRNVTALISTFVSSPFSRVLIGSVEQVSGITANDFTNPVSFRCEAQDGSIEIYLVTVSHAPASNQKDILAFGFEGLLREAIGVIDQINRIVTVHVPGETDVKNIKATFTLSPLAVAKIGGAMQISGSTPNDFTNLVQYTIVAEDNTVNFYLVRVIAGPNVDKRILTFGFLGLPVSAEGIIDELAKTIVIYVPFSTSRDGLVASFTSSARSTVWVGTIPQQSGSTANNFNSVKTYTVKAEDNTFQDYQVLVWKSPALDGNQITEFSFSLSTSPVAATINQLTNTITAELPYGTSPVWLVPTFTTSLLASVTVSGIAQYSGVTSNDFSNPLIYRCTSESGLIHEYVVTVKIITASTEKRMTYFAFEGLIPDCTGIFTNDSTIAVDVPEGTPVMGLIANFSISVKARAFVGSVEQISGETPNNFTSMVVYKVYAEDGTTADYFVTVSFFEDTVAPVVTNSLQVLDNAQGEFAVLKSSEGTGKVYMIRSDAPQISPVDLEISVAAGLGRSANVTNADAEIRISTYAMQQGVYKTYAVDLAGNKSLQGINSITVYDVLAPTVFMQVQTVSNAPSKFINVSSSDNSGYVYLLLEGTPGSTKQQLDAAIGVRKGQRSQVSVANANVPVGTHLLWPGHYRAFAVDDYGNVSAQSSFASIITQAKSEKSILAFSFNGLTPPAIGQINGNDIFVKVNDGTSLTGLVANFSLSPDAKAFVGLVEQSSGFTPNNFTDNVVYTIEAEDGSTMDYKITVSHSSSFDPQVWFAGIKSYPNPFTGLLTIEMTRPADRIQIINALGQTVKDIIEPDNTVITIETITWIKGFYFVRYFMEGYTGVQKIIRN